VSMGRLLLQLFDVTEQFGMHLRPELVLLQKTMVQVEGVARGIDPDHDIWESARPVVERFMRRELGPEGLARRAMSEVRAGLDALRKLPALVERLDAAATRHGRGRARP
jgi:ubiquinone biosynthesis protein